MLYIQAKIIPINASEAENAKVAPINNFLHSMFNQVDVFLNQKLVSPYDVYPFRAYIESLLNYSLAAKELHLTSSLWINDTDGAFEVLQSSAAPNPVDKGLESRKYFTQGGKTFDMIGHLHCDIFNQDKMLINGVEMRVRLVRSKGAFCLMDDSDDGKFKVHIKEATLVIRRVKINPGVLLAHVNALAKTTAKYPISRVKVKYFTFHAGILGDTIDNAILGQLPKRTIIGFVDNRAFNGNHEFNPYNFQNFSINYLSLYVDSVRIPSKPLQPCFSGDSKLYIDALHTLFLGTGKHFLNEGIGINRFN